MAVFRSGSGKEWGDPGEYCTRKIRTYLKTGKEMSKRHLERVPYAKFEIIWASKVPVNQWQQWIITELIHSLNNVFNSHNKYRRNNLIRNLPFCNLQSNN